jgi:hypothetical protein
VLPYTIFAIVAGKLLPPPPQPLPEKVVFNHETMRVVMVHVEIPAIYPHFELTLEKKVPVHGLRGDVNRPDGFEKGFLEWKGLVDFL